MSREPNPFDHSQLATLSELDVEYDRETGGFTFIRRFDFSRGGALEGQAESVAETWREQAAETNERAPYRIEVTVEDDTLELRISADGIDNRHVLGNVVGLLVNELVTMVATHDPEKAVQTAGNALEAAEEVERWRDE